MHQPVPEQELQEHLMQNPQTIGLTSNLGTETSGEDSGVHSDPILVTRYSDPNGLINPVSGMSSCGSTSISVALIQGIVFSSLDVK